MKFLFLTLISVILVTACAFKDNKPKKAAKEFCNCLFENKRLGKYSTLEYCNKLISNKYTVYRIYQETRDKNINDMYDKKTVKKVLDFIYEFTSEVDKIGPPYWFLEKNAPIY